MSETTSESLESCQKRQKIAIERQPLRQQQKAQASNATTNPVLTCSALTSLQT